MMTIAPSDVGGYRARISGSSFYTAMRLMPKVEREAMFAIYLFCRLVDDIADDGTRPRPARAAALTEWRKDLDALYGGRPAGQASFLQAAVRTFGLKQSDFLDVIDGMEMDVVADIRAPEVATLHRNCERNGQDDWIRTTGTDRHGCRLVARAPEARGLPSFPTS